MKTPIGIGDSPEHADKNAWMVREAQARVQTMAKLIAGHAVEIVNTNDPEKVTLRVGGVDFTDLREQYPSTQLVANIALAVDAAKFSPDAFKIDDFDEQDLARFDPRTHKMISELELEETAHNNVRRLSLAERKAGDVKW
jgi:hypothetical protein